MDEQETQLEFSFNPDQEEEDTFMETYNFGSSSDSRYVSINRKPLQNRLRIRIKVRNNRDDNDEIGSVCNETAASINRLSLIRHKLFRDRTGAHDYAQEEHELANYDKKRATKHKNQLRNSGFGSNRSKRGKRIKLKLAAASNSEQKASNGNSIAEESGEEEHDSSPQQKSKTDCSLCGKNFPSMKSLFGHMRCHPERDWRGIVPPERIIVTEKNSPPSSAVSNSGTNVSNRVPDSDTGGEKPIDQIDCPTTESCRGLGNHASSLSNWSVTAKRGRKSTFNDTSKLGNPPDQVSDAAHFLMILANANSKNRKETDCRNSDFGSTGVKTEQNVLEKEDGNGGFGSEKSNFYEVVDGFADLGHLEKKTGGSESKNTEFGSETVKILEEKQLNYRSDHRKKKRKIRSLETVQNLGLFEPKLNIAEKYSCSTCNKSFSSHQALGGHRASHKKGKTNPTVGELDEFAAAEVPEKQVCLVSDPTHGEDFPESCDPLPENQVTHRCKICNKQFPTGQALGGHKRCHWTGDKTIATSMEIPVDGRKMARALLDFDLNEPPIIEEEDLVSAISMIDVVPASSQSLGSMLKDYAPCYCSSVIS